MSAAPLLQNDVQELKTLLQTCFLFQEAPAEAIEYAAHHAERVAFKNGDCIILENEANNWVYFIAQGSVEIVSYLAGDNRIQRLALLKEGSNFAEFSILTHSARSGSAYAFGNCVLVRVDGAGFISLLKSFPVITQRLLKHLADLNQSVESFDEMLPYYKPSQLTVSAEALQHLPLALCQKYGVIPVSFKSGLLTVIMKNPQSKEFYDFAAKTFPKTELSVLLITESEFDSAFQTAQKSLKLSLSSPSQENRNKSSATEPLDHLKNSELFGEVKEEILQQVLQHIKPLKFDAGASVSTAGSSVDSYHLIVKGSVQFYRKLSHLPALSPVLTLTAGDGYGEVQLISGGTFGYLARALEETVIYPIPASIFKQLLKLPIFSVALAKTLAQRLQLMGHTEGLHYFKSKESLDFSAVAHLLPPALMEQQKVLPLMVKDNEVILGSVHPDNSEVLSLTKRYLLNYRLRLYGISDEDFRAWYPQIKALNNHSSGTAPALAGMPAKPKFEATNWIDQILLLGMNNRSSDIHLEPTESHLGVRFRIDGVLQEHTETIPVEAGKEVINRLKILSEMDISQFHLPQDGQLKLTVGKMQIMARASTVPVRNGEKMVLRLIRSQDSVVPLAMLSPHRRAINILTSVTRCRQGLFLVTGPTGSGKTTTLYSMLNAINDIGVNVVTLEDPVEMEITGFNQIEMDRKRGMDFNLALRSVLRQDPNIIMVGEIRDEESAKIVMEASITGHLVLSTLHTSSAFDIVPRLSELGVTPATLASGLLGVLTQRLLRLNCKKCLTSRPSSESEKELFREMLPQESAPERIFYSVGCPSCSNTGYRHRTPVFEIWRNTAATRKAILERASAEEMMIMARDDGFETLLESGLKLVLSGLVSLEEVRRVLSTI